MAKKTINAKKFIEDMERQDKVTYAFLKPSADYDEKFDMIYIGFSGGEGCKSTIETHTQQGHTIRFDLNQKGRIVGVEIEGLIGKGKEFLTTNEISKKIERVAKRKK